MQASPFRQPAQALRVLAFGSLTAAPLLAGGGTSGLTERVSFTRAGVPVSENCGAPAISADGRYVAFASLATEFAAGDINGTWDVFVRDRVAGTTEWTELRITAWDDLDTNLTGQDIAGSDAEVFFVPVDFGSTAIAYNAETVPEADVASLSVFHNPAYAGRMTIPDNVDDAFALAYLATGTTDWSGGVTDAQFDAAVAWLREAHPLMRTYWTDPAELSQLLASGEVLVSWAWNETLPTMVEEGFPIGFEREPAEGSSLWLCGYVNLADGPGDEAKAYDYVNAMLAPEATSALLESGYGQANVAAMAAKGEEALVAAGLGQIEAPVLAQLPMSIELREKHNEAFERIKAGF